MFLENHAVCEIMCENIVKPCSPQMTIWYMYTACWITEARDTHLEYVILIAFPRQQWLLGRTSPLRDMYVACFVFVYNVVGNMQYVCKCGMFDLELTS